MFPFVRSKYKINMRGQYIRASQLHAGARVPWSMLHFVAWFRFRLIFVHHARPRRYVNDHGIYGLHRRLHFHTSHSASCPLYRFLCWNIMRALRFKISSNPVSQANLRLFFTRNAERNCISRIIQIIVITSSNYFSNVIKEIVTYLSFLHTCIFLHFFF